MDWYFRALQAGTPWSFVLLFGQVVLLAMVIERSVFLVIKARVNTTVFLQALGKLAAAGNADRAVKLTKALDAPVGRVCRVGLEGLGKGPFLLSDELDRAIAKELPLIRRRLGTIPLLAIGIVAVGVIGSALQGAGTPNFAEGPLPFGLGEEHALALVGVASGMAGLLWSVALASQAKRAVADLERCKAFVLDLDVDWNQQAAARP